MNVTISDLCLGLFWNKVFDCLDKYSVGGVDQILDHPKITEG